MSVWLQAVEMRFLSFSSGDFFIIRLTASLETSDKVGNSGGTHFLQYHRLQLQGQRKCCRERERESLHIDHCAVLHKQCTCTKILLIFHTCFLIMQCTTWTLQNRTDCLFATRPGPREIVSTTYSFRTLYRKQHVTIAHHHLKLPGRSPRCNLRLSVLLKGMMVIAVTTSTFH